MPGEEEKETETTEELIQAIAELKKTTVGKEEYKKLQEENSKLLKVLVEGGQIEPPERKQESIEDLRKDLFGEDKHLTNLEFAEKALALRRALIDEGKGDPFCPVGHRVTSDEEDLKAAARVASVLQECIDYAKGDSQLFTNEIQRRMVDSAPMQRRK